MKSWSQKAQKRILQVLSGYTGIKTGTTNQHESTRIRTRIIIPSILFIPVIFLICIINGQNKKGAEIKKEISYPSEA
jgi:hypothetical protein